MNPQRSQSQRIIRPKEACCRSGLSLATFWRRAKSDPEFPKLFPLGTGARAVGMFESDFDTWLKNCATSQEPKQ